MLTQSPLWLEFCSPLVFVFNTSEIVLYLKSHGNHILVKAFMSVCVKGNMKQVVAPWNSSVRAVMALSAAFSKYLMIFCNYKYCIFFSILWRLVDVSCVAVTSSTTLFSLFAVVEGGFWFMYNSTATFKEKPNKSLCVLWGVYDGVIEIVQKVTYVVWWNLH